jgi:hypothetical protein
MTQDGQWFEERKAELTEYLTNITSGLIEMARAQGRTRYTKNQLLRECYNIGTFDELHTIDEWHKLGRQIREIEHGYLFWYNGEAVLLFTSDQLMAI